MLDFDATSLYRSSMCNEHSVYPKIDSGFAIKPNMNDAFVEAFNNQTFNQHGKEIAFLKMKNYSSPNLIFEHFPVKEQVKNIEVNRMRNGYIIDTLTKVEIQEIIKIRG